MVIIFKQGSFSLLLKREFILEYHCGSDLGWSDLFTFTTLKEGSNWSPRLAVFGDMGNKNAQSLPRLQQETQRGHFDTILHVGDFAYDMDTVSFK
jgi:acid phosphatase type 7